MMTLRQTYEVCKRGYIYDIEHDRFISNEEDKKIYAKQYAPAGVKMVGAFLQAVKTVLEHHGKLN